MGIGLTELLTFLNGAIAASCFAVGLVFFKYWFKTHDSLFGYFAVAFWLITAERSLMALFVGRSAEENLIFYSLRLAAFMVILVAIAGKNRQTASR